MEPISDAECGSWLRLLLGGTGGGIHCVVPRGYAAYARVFHPAARDRTTGVDAAPVSWARVAQAFGTTMHPLAQYHRLAGPETGKYREVLDASGWRYSEPQQGNLDVDALASVAAILCRHTATPEIGVVAIWEGWGGLANSTGYSQLTAFPDQTGPGAESQGTRRQPTATAISVCDLADLVVSQCPCSADAFTT